MPGLVDYVPLLPACRRKSWSPGSASQWLCSLLPLAVSCGLLSARLESRDARRLATLSIGIFDVVQQRETRKASAQSHEADGHCSVRLVAGSDSTGVATCLREGSISVTDHKCLVAILEYP